MPPKPEYLLKPFKTVRSFESWLAKNHARADGLRVQFAKKSSGIRSVTYDEALEVALCYGWIDGQVKTIDETWYWQKFTPRRTRSPWSVRNRGIVAHLIEEGRMRPAGQAEIDRAKADGRWDRAYESPANAKVPADLAAALRKSAGAKRAFQFLSASNRYSILHRLMTAKKPETRARRLREVLEMLGNGKND